MKNYNVLELKRLLATGEYQLLARMFGCEWHNAIDFRLKEDDYKVVKKKLFGKDEQLQMKPTITALAKHIGRTNQAMQYMKKHNPKQFELLMMGWKLYCSESTVKESK